METLLLVDGSNLLFQMFYGMPARIVGKSGKLIHGTLGFVGSLLKIIKITNPTHVIVLFDGECHNERKDLDCDYKANRPDFSQMTEEEIPFSQLPDIYAALDFLKIAHAETTVCETDDMIAAYALRYKKEMQVVISSFDSDFFQLIDKNIRVLRYRGEKTILCDEAFVKDKFGVTPKQYADFKSLVGDTADNIKGVPMVGMKRAGSLLSQFGSLENLLKNTQDIAAASLRSAIETSVERIYKNQRLIRLEGCEKVPFSLEEAAFTYAGTKTGEVLSAIGVK